MECLCDDLFGRTCTLIQSYFFKIFREGILSGGLTWTTELLCPMVQIIFRMHLSEGKLCRVTWILNLVMRNYKINKYKNKHINKNLTTKRKTTVQMIFSPVTNSKPEIRSQRNPINTLLKQI